MELTSENSPLRIAEVSVPGAGLLGLTLCPGKRQPGTISGSWRRDLEADLDAVHRWGAGAVVTLMETWELAHLGVPSLGERIAARGMAWHHLPIRDGDVPEKGFEQSWHRHGPELRQRLSAGERILIHCRAGLGRTGLVAARLLIEMGESPPEALKRVRATRPGAVETPAQERYVLRGL